MERGIDRDAEEQGVRKRLQSENGTPYLASMRTILIIILILLLIGAFPAWPYSTGWGYYPSGGLGLILLIVLLVVFLR